MKVTKIAIIITAGFLAVSCSNSNLKTKNTLNNEVDSVSYVVGLNMANQMKAEFKDIDLDLVIQGLINGKDSTNLLVDNKNLDGILRKYFTKLQEEKKQKRKEEYVQKVSKEFAEHKKENEAFLTTNKTKKGVKTTNSGLQYEVIREGKGVSPSAIDKVKVLYKGTLIDGKTVFDSNENRKKPSEFVLTQVILGWSEGLQLMKPGAKYKFYIPQELAYKFHQKGEYIKPFSTLVFEVELLDVIKRK